MYYKYNEVFRRSKMKPQIEFKHVLGELSLNRNDPCELIRELISNSYDANASRLFYTPIKDNRKIIFLDNGAGLDYENKTNGITPWEAFFSIGKSTKRKGDAIGYKCQGSKLCFASSRVLIATKIKSKTKTNDWVYKIVENPRNNLDTDYSINHSPTKNIQQVIDEFLSNPSAETSNAINEIKKEILNESYESGTLIIIDGFDAVNFNKYFVIGENPEESYVYNYIRFYTVHGDVRHLQESQGFQPNQILQVSQNLKKAKLLIFNNQKSFEVPFGFQYLDIPDSHDQVPKSPSEISRLRDSRFFSRGAKKISVNSESYSLILAIDGNRRAHEEYINLARKGKTQSGIKLSEQRGVFISVKGVKICKYTEIFENINEYQVLSDADSLNHYTLIIDGDFDLVTNRTSLSKNALEKLSDKEFINQVKIFLDQQRTKDKIFSELISRLKKESTENLLNDQIEIFNNFRKNIKKRERFTIKNAGEISRFLSPIAGEEYLVGVLYAQIGERKHKKTEFDKYWRKILTFSTQGIDSMGLIDKNSTAMFAESNICSIEYKFELNKKGPFNHALAVVNYIVAWNVDLEDNSEISDTYTCFGKVKKVPENDFEWEISEIQSQDGGSYDSNIIKVIDLKKLIISSFDDVKFTQAP